MKYQLKVWFEAENDGEAEVVRDEIAGYIEDGNESGIWDAAEVDLAAEPQVEV